LHLMNGIEDKSIDMILCDLPYGTTQNKWDSIIDFDKLWLQYNRIIEDNGVVVLFGNEPFSSAMRNSNTSMYRYDWYWGKNISTGFQNANKQPMRNVETISVFYKRQPTYNPQGLLPYNKVSKRGSMGQNWRSGTKGMGGEMGTNQYIQEYTNYPRNLIFFDCATSNLHPTQKPVALFEYLIKTYTNEGDLVLDNCIGSGTTAIAAINSNRNYIGIELDENYYNIANQRIDEFKNGLK